MSEAVASRPMAQPKPRIMVIDDEPANLQVVKMVVLREHFHCDLVLMEDAQKALERLRGEPVDLILLDVVMPRMNGFEMYEALRQEPELADIPVIFLSAVQEPEYITRGLEMGAADYIGKPIISQVLTARIRSVLRMKFLQSELKQRNAELQSANHLKDEFLSICSHDLRSPLSAIELICQLLQETVPEGEAETSQELIGRIFNQTKLARTLVENLLDLNKIEEGKVVAQPTFFSLQELLEGCVEDQQPIMLAKNVRFRQAPVAERAVCFGDREMIAQMVRNLLGNAVKFARASVSLVHRLEGLERDDGGTWVLQVTDDGQGISPEQVKTIFDKYTTTDLHNAGYGLGLYISHQTVKLHNGTIHVDSRPNESTTLTVRLPLVFDRERLPDLSDISRTAVRIYSSSRDTANLLENVLLEAGLVYVTTEAPEDVTVEQVQAEPPDVAVIDLQSSPLDYFPLVRLMNNEELPTRWVFLGSAEELESTRILTARPHAGLQRPVNPARYLRTVKSLMADRGTEMLTRLA